LNVDNQNILVSAKSSRRLTYGIFSPRIRTDTVEEAEKVLPWHIGCEHANSTLSELNNDLPGLDHLLQLKQRLWKLWHGTRDPACKAALNWVTKTIRTMTRRKTTERWETKISNSEATSHAI
jgi:hypothetical protein